MKKVLSLVAAACVSLGSSAMAAYTSQIFDTPGTDGEIRHGIWLSNFTTSGPGISKFWGLNSGSSIETIGTTSTITGSVTNETNASMTLEFEFIWEVITDPLLEPDLAYCQSGAAKAVCNDLTDTMTFLSFTSGSFTGVGELGEFSAVLTPNSGHPPQCGPGGDAFNPSLEGCSAWYYAAFSSTGDEKVTVAGSEYSIRLSDVGSVGGDINFTTMPVPGAVVFFGSAIAAFVARRKLISA
ncbi:MAG: hypothetical protein AAFX52_04625 [Pseudomonadota bacterium]